MNLFMVSILLLLLTFHNLQSQWQINSQLLHPATSISFYNDTIYVGGGNEIIISDDKGSTWKEYAKFNTNSINEIILKNNMQFVGLDRGIYAFGSLEFNMFRSFDYGKTWDSLHVLYNANYYSPGGISDLTLHNDDLYCGVNAKLIKSSDFGNTWFSDTLFENNLYPHYPIGIHSTGTHLLASFFDSSLYILNEVTDYWHLLSQELPNEKYYEIEGNNDTIIIASSSSIYISYNAGNSWQNINNNFTDTLSIYGMYLFGNELFITTEKAKIFFCKIGEFIWKEISDGLDNLEFNYIPDMAKTKDKFFVLTLSAIYESDISNIVSVEVGKISGNKGVQLNVYPNPFNIRTNIEIKIPNNEYASVEIYNILGQKISTIFENVKLSTETAFEFDAKSFSSGIYFILLRTNQTVLSKKIILLK